MCIAEQRDAIRIQTQDLVHGLGKGRRRLIRQSVNQVDVDAVKSQLPRGINNPLGHLIGLDTVNGLLHLRLEVLNAHAQPVEAKPAKGLEVSPRCDAGIDLDANLRIRTKRKVLARKFEEILDLRRRKIGWRAAAPVELNDRPLA